MDEKANPIVALAKLLALYVPVAVAEIIAPQLGAFLAGIAGGVFGVMGWRKSSRMPAFGYVLLAGFGGWLFAYPLSHAVTVLWPGIGSNSSLHQLCALAIGMVGHRWPVVGRWLGRTLKASAEAALKRGPE